MNGSAIHVNDAGTTFRVTITDDDVPEAPLDLSSATTQEFRFVRPDGTTFDRTTTFTGGGGDGVVEYTTVLADLDQAGPWKLQFHYVLPAAERRADVLEFTVKENA